MTSSPEEIDAAERAECRRLMQEALRRPSEVLDEDRTLLDSP